MNSSSKQNDLIDDQDNLFEFDKSSDTVSMETHIPSNNVGYRMLQKMGWMQGKGLGSQGQGRIDPIRIEIKDDSLGVGKAEEYQQTHVSTTSKRKALDSEKQLEESEQQRFEREQRAEKKKAIEKELEQVKRAFYCELCDKQYKKISEFEQHLQSYDHHHKKRFRDMKESARNSTINQSEREKKLARERKREERELKRMQKAIQKKAGSV
ncbi:MAG: G-patch domain-containing protein, partial [Benjaminiella poitrasii]